MTALFPAQRAAEEFDQVLAGTADDAVTARYTGLLEAVEELRALPEVTPREAFSGDLRARLMTAAETELVAAPRTVTSLPEVRARRRRRLGTAAASLVIVGGSAGMAAAASGALPGEPLYPVKRGIEQVGTAARFDDASHGKALLGQAATRLEEVSALQAEGSPDADLTASTLGSFRDAADAGADQLFALYQAGGDTGDINAVRDFTATQMAVVTDLASTADAPTLGLLVDAADTLADIDQQARVLCGGCGPGTTIQPPGTLSAGAAALSLDNLIARPVAQVRADIARSQAAQEAEAERLAQLQAAAEQAAGEIPKTDPGSGAGSSTDPDSSSGPGSTVTSTITPDGKLVPSINTGAAVKDLVNDVTGTVKDLTKKLTKGVTGNGDQGKDPLDGTVKDLTDTVDEATGNLLP